VAVGGETVGRLTFALFGKAAPTITSNFLRVLDGKAQGASYDYSSVWRVQKASERRSASGLVGWTVCRRTPVLSFALFLFFWSGSFEAVIDAHRLASAAHITLQTNKHRTPHQDTCIDLGRVTGGGGKKLQKNINESGYMRISAANAADWTSNTEVNDLRHTEPFLLTTKRGACVRGMDVCTHMCGVCS